jgi:cytochrome c peroxidase
MKFFIGFNIFCVLLLIISLPNKEIQFSAEENLKIQSLKSDIVPEKKNFTQEESIGRELFFHKWRGNDGVFLSCASCHNKILTPKNFTHKLKFKPPPLVDIFSAKWIGWEGHSKAKNGWQEKILKPLFEEKEHNLSRENFLNQLSSLGYPASANFFAESIISYLNSINIKNSRFEENNLSLSENRGLKIFVGKGNCIMCHNGSRLSNGAFHNVGVPLNDVLSSRIENNMNGRNSGKFRTPCLKCSLAHSPYFHNGAYVTLEEVVEHYNRAPEAVSGETEIAPLGLVEHEKRDLVNFLKVFSHL